MSLSFTCAACCVDCGVFAQVQPVFCGARCCGRGGFQTRPYGMGNGRSETRPYGMGSVRRDGTCFDAMLMVRGGANTCLVHAIAVCGW